MKSRLSTLAAVTITLAVSGLLLNGFVSPVWAAMRRHEPALQPDRFAQGAGPGVLLAVLGGLRSLVADAAWLQMHNVWEQRDWVATQILLHFAPAIDPRPLYYWLNGARIMACDFPAWRIAAGGGEERMPASAQGRIRREQADAGLAFLAEAMTYHPTSPELWIERASIELYRVGDIAAAAASYRQAWALPGAPYFVARVHAQLLRRAGRPAEALAWLVQLHPSLPRHDDAAAADSVMDRIRELEAELGVSAEKSYQASP